MGDEGADSGRVTITDGWTGCEGNERFGKSLNWLMVGMLEREKIGPA